MSRGAVSGNLARVQTASPAAATAVRAKMPRQPTISTINPDNAGATIGATTMAAVIWPITAAERSLP